MPLLGIYDPFCRAGGSCGTAGRSGNVGGEGGMGTGGHKGNRGSRAGPWDQADRVQPGLGVQVPSQPLGVRHSHLEECSLGVAVPVPWKGVWGVIPGPQPGSDAVSSTEGAPRPKVTQQIHGEKQPQEENLEC